MTDAEILRRMRLGETAALERLIDRYNSYAVSIAAAMLPHREDVEEVVSDVFLALWRHAGEISAQKLKAYVGAAVRNKARDLLRRQREPDEALDLLEVSCPEAGPEGALLRQERQRLVRQALDEMTPTDREIFLRFYYYMQPSSTIAEALGLSDGAVRTRLSRGRAALKTLLEKECSQ